ncbi:GNAT family N-acetyltransferase [Streptomyces sp. NBC_00669]|uniref:GNAT family N-acetyltransferase n=1 Tax=Streptomyces sp. NBC_00669 TaxID=2976011 RepID=UPI002E338B45|nr:GNAT family protein [Streptomyces sp. NBC_00669]
MASPRGADLTAPTILRAHGLVLRPVVASDEPAVARAMTDGEVLQWAAGMAVLDAPPKDRATVWLSARLTAWSTGTAAFAVTDPADDVMIGYLGLRDVHRVPDQAVAGYWVTPAARGRKVTARALDAAADWAFSPAYAGGLGLHRIVLDHVLHNVGSCRAALRAGFAEEGVMREAFVEPNGKRHDCHLHARLATDPSARPFD